MTQDEIRKLLAGYATDALTADERRSLFEAALEDQALFNALENEDALKELLADPALRDQVRRALQTPGRATRRHPFSWRRWGLGVAVPAMVALILVAVMNHANAPKLIAPLAEESRLSIPPAAPAQASPKAEPVTGVAAAPVAKRESKPAPAIIPGVQADAASNRAPTPLATSFLAASRRPVPDALQQQFSTALAQTGTFYQGPLVHYSLVRSGDAQDSVRVEVSTRIAGYLALYRLDAAGNSMRVYPELDPAVMILPDSPILIPGTAMKITDAGARLRVVLLPSPAAAVSGQLTEPSASVIGGAVNGAVRPALAQPFGAPASAKPLVVDIPLAP